MNLSAVNATGIIGLAFVLAFFGLMIFFAAAGRGGRGAARPRTVLREIPAFDRLGHAVGLAVEAGQRLHISLGRGTFSGLEAGSALIGLAVLARIARTTSISDRPPVATSGDGILAILSRDTLRSSFQKEGAGARYDPTNGQLSGLTPFAYAAGTLPILYDQETSASILSGHFGAEAALIADAAQRRGSLTVGGSDNLTGQAVLYAAAQEPLIGEELYAAGAYLGAGPFHLAGVQAQDVLRWVVAGAILAGAGLKLLGVL